MNKRMRELLALIDAKHIEAKGYTEGEGKDIDKANSLLDEADVLQKEYAVEERLLNAKKEEVTDEVIKETSLEKSIKAFAAAARGGFKGMNEGAGTDGGYTVPEDIQTQIIELKTAEFSLLDLVDVVSVGTMAGSRTYKKRSQQTGFAKVGEGGKIGQKETPKFDRVSYAIDKYAGFFPVTNEVLEDSDANLTSVITAWIAGESRVTANKLILAELDTIGTPETISGLDDIKAILNVKLGQAFKPTSKIITNDDGLQWLDTLKNEKGEYLLQPNPADPMILRLCAGATTVEVKVIPNTDLPSKDGNAPVYIGDLKEAIKFFDHKRMNIKASDVAAAGDLNAYDEDLTLFRAIEREDVVVFDEAACVRGKIALG